MGEKLREHYKDNLFWIVWVCQYDPFGRVIDTTVLPYHYKNKSSAVRRAKKLYGENNPRYEWVVKPVYMFPEHELIKKIGESIVRGFCDALKEGREGAK